ncbi:AAA family ATPase [Phytohabitans houttuyneae]|uniref:ATPase n=1 Tax=Phytohabitans houttuyneae TaxID=1076126 RepID=A0A6V8KSC2_9ACTN|nr:AAA family ATPase [Phytohabitans houttuyneae]GFJ84726.1 ATPase [Phytohabitans houttuyneae]
MELYTIEPAEFNRRFAFLTQAVGSRLLGKSDKVELSLICLIADGHLLLEDLPGLGKTSLAQTLATAIGGSYGRVQGTPDLLPSDITGSLILDTDKSASRIHQRDDGFKIRKGPVFANVLLCDEINRTPPRTQSALLEAMEERQVTIFDETRELPDPFFVIATQNPVDLDGTYALPEAQLDRFLMRLTLGYPDTDVFCTVLRDFGGRRRPGTSTGSEASATGFTPDHVLDMIHYAERLPAGEIVRRDIAAIVEATRDPDRALLGASPRAGLALLRAARAYAAARGHLEVHTDHVRVIAPDVLAHRIILRHPPVAEVADAQREYILDILRRTPTGKRRL